MRTLTLINSEVSDIYFVGHRYSWSKKLVDLIQEFGEDTEEGTIIKMPEHKGWELNEAIDEDTEGNHSFFPMLDGESNLAKKLMDFYQETV